MTEYILHSDTTKLVDNVVELMLARQKLHGIVVVYDVSELEDVQDAIDQELIKSDWRWHWIAERWTTEQGGCVYLKPHSVLWGNWIHGHAFGMIALDVRKYWTRVGIHNDERLRAQLREEPGVFMETEWGGFEIGNLGPRVYVGRGYQLIPTITLIDDARNQIELTLHSALALRSFLNDMLLG